MEYILQPNRFSRLIANYSLRLRSWKLDINRPPYNKYVLIGAPHTSNWDFLMLLFIKYGGGVDLHWVGKDNAFRGPMNPFFRNLGGIPVNRRSRNNFVSQMVEVFNQRDEFVLCVAPEGTRKKAEGWKTGFYYIALGAGVPIAMAFVDYRQKVVGIGPTVIFPTGDIQADFTHIKAFYSGITGRYPDKQGEIRL